MQKKILHRSKEGSAKMILDSQELEFLKLCALARYMPCGLAGIFEMQILKSEVSVGKKRILEICKRRV